jgi:Uma2 family endonuclease
MDYTLSMGANTTLMTVQQFLELPHEQLRRHELWHGELIYMGETIFAHNWIREMLFFCIRQFLLASKVGGEVLVETGIQFDSNTLARPDVSYWDGQHLAAVDWNHSPVEIVPQLLAEVVSPSNSLRTLFRNAEYYLRAGVQVVWILDRNPFEIHVFEKGKDKRTIRPGEMLDAPSVLPGFSVNVSSFVPPER